MKRNRQRRFRWWLLKALLPLPPGIWLAAAHGVTTCGGKASGPQATTRVGSKTDNCCELEE